MHITTAPTPAVPARAALARLALAVTAPALLLAACTGHSSSHSAAATSGASAGGGSGAGSGAAGGSGQAGSGNSNGVQSGSTIALPKGLPKPAGDQATTSVSGPNGGTWSFTGTTSAQYDAYVATLRKGGWKCAPTEANLPTFGFTCAATQQGVTGSVHVYYLPGPKAITLNYTPS